MAAFSLCAVPPPPPLSKHLKATQFSELKPIVFAGNPPTFVSAPGRRIVAVGDLHGDLSQTRRALEMAGVLSPGGENVWIGGETVLVQLGDILDRGEDEIAILSLLRSLDVQAKLTGGAVFQVNGNHETMNVEGDFRFVDPGAYDECMDFLEYLDEHNGNWDDAFIGWIDVTEQWKDKRKSESHWSPWNIIKKQEGILARSSLFRSGGLLACELARHAVILKIDDWIFCHGGLLPHHAAYGIERMNKEVSCWMRDLSEESDGPEIPFIATRGYDSVVWSRLYSRDSADSRFRSLQISSILEETLQAVGAKRMVVGHTPQFNGVTSKYNQRIWCIDVGMSSGVLNTTPEVLEIIDNKARVIKNQTNLVNDLEAMDFL